MDERITTLARRYRPVALELLKEAIRIPADHVDAPPEAGGDPACGLSNHEGPRLEYLRRKIVAVGAVDRPEDVGFDEFGNLVWTVQDPGDGVPTTEKTVIYLDGHADTVDALRPRWHEAIGSGIDPYLGLLDPERVEANRAGDQARMRDIERRALERNREHADWICDAARMSRTREGRGLYLHCLPADIGAEVSREVFDAARVDLAREANKKLYAIMAVLAASKEARLVDRLREIVAATEDIPDAAR